MASGEVGGLAIYDDDSIYIVGDTDNDLHGKENNGDEESVENSTQHRLNLLLADWTTESSSDNNAIAAFSESGTL